MAPVRGRWRRRGGGCRYVSGWSAARSRCNPPPPPPGLGLASLTGACVTDSSTNTLKTAQRCPFRRIQRCAKLTRLIRYRSAKGWDVEGSRGYSPLKTMAAEAPITPKKGEYSGLSSEDILALFSGRCGYGAGCVPVEFQVFSLRFSLWQVQALTGGQQRSCQRGSPV